MTRLNDVSRLAYKSSSRASCLETQNAIVRALANERGALASEGGALASERGALASEGGALARERATLSKSTIS